MADLNRQSRRRADNVRLLPIAAMGWRCLTGLRLRDFSGTVPDEIKPVPGQCQPGDNE